MIDQYFFRGVIDQYLLQQCYLVRGQNFVKPTNADVLKLGWM